MKLQESQSWKNIEAALNAEALAYVEYVFYGQQAKKDGYVQMSNLSSTRSSRRWPATRASTTWATSSTA